MADSLPPGDNSSPRIAATREPDERIAELDDRSQPDDAAILSRRSMLKAGALAAATAFGTKAAAQSAAPAATTGRVAGMPFRAFVRHGTTSSVEDLRLRDIGPRQVLVRSTASCGCYTITRSVLGQNPVQ